VTKAEEIVRTEFERSYKYSTNVWATEEGTDSTMTVRYTIILIQSLTNLEIAGGSWRKNTGRRIIEEHF
jgi:hypothetical protein